MNQTSSPCCKQRVAVAGWLVARARRPRRLPLPAPAKEPGAVATGAVDRVVQREGRRVQPAQVDHKARRVEQLRSASRAGIAVTGRPVPVSRTR